MNEIDRNSCRLRAGFNSSKRSRYSPLLSNLHLPTAVRLRFTQIHPYMRRRSVTELDGTDGKAEIFHTLNSTINNALNAVQQL